MSASEELRAKVDANVKKLSYIDDKAQVQTGIGVTLASLFGFTLLLAFFALWISAEYGKHVPVAVDLAFYAALVLWAMVVTVLGGGLLSIILGMKLRKETSALRDEVNALEKAEMALQLKKAANQRAAEREAERMAEREAKEISIAALSFDNSPQAKPAQNPGYGKSEGSSKPGGTSTQGKGSSGRKEL